MSDKDKKIHKCPTEGENYDSPQVIFLAKETFADGLYFLIRS